MAWRVDGCQAPVAHGSCCMVLLMLLSLVEVVVVVMMRITLPCDIAEEQKRAPCANLMLLIMTMMSGRNTAECLLLRQDHVGWNNTACSQSLTGELTGEDQRLSRFRPEPRVRVVNV